MSMTTMAVEAAPLLFRQAGAPKSGLRVSVIVPVKNEAHHLAATLTALASQTNGAGQPLDGAVYEVLLLANNCTDDSAAVACRYQQAFPRLHLHVEELTLPPAKSNIGYVRRLLMDEACSRLQTAGVQQGIIASTDGDTIVDRQWIHQIISEIDKGADAVGGRILTRTTNHSARVYYLRDVMYRTLLAKAEHLLDPQAHDAWPKHFQYFGASFAVTCDAYLRAGRLPAKTYLEDAAFHDALLLVDARVRKSNAVKTYTSARLQGKVAVGFSEQLQKWSEMAQQDVVQLVESTDVSLKHFQHRALLRACWQKAQRHDAGMIGEAAQQLSLCPHWLLHEVRCNEYFGQLWQKAEGEIKSNRKSSGYKLVPITEAINELRIFVHKHHL